MGKRNEGKRKNTRKKPPARADGGATGSNNYCCVGGGGSGSKNDKFAAFDFTDADHRVETESRKILAKFGPKSPSRKPLHNRKSVDKYTFLESFAHGQQKDSGNDTRIVDLTESGFQDKTFGTDVTMSPGSLKYEPYRSSFSKFQGAEYSCGEKSCAQRSRRLECYTAGKEHNKILCVDSSEDGDIEFRSSSSINLAENEGSINDCSSENDADSNDCETVVAVAPRYAKYGENYYTRCFLTFSQKCIRLKGSPLRVRRTSCIEWPTSDVLNIECQQCESVKADVVNIHMKSKVTNVGETDDWNSGSVELEFVILDDPQWSKKQEDIKSLDPKFKASWKINVSGSFKESFEDLVYPDGDPDAVFISRRDIDVLQPGTFINDTIIDFYFKYLSDKIRTEDRHRFHFFNTFFFQKLVALRRDSSREGRVFFQSVRKWTRNVNIFETDYIFIPVNFSLHWSLIIICHPGKVAYLRDKVTDESPMVPCILHMDSIRGSHRGLEDLIRWYLLEEWKERGNKHDEDILMKFLNLEFVSLQLPQQENWVDCGLFLLHYAEQFLEQASNSSTTDFFDNLNKDWFLPAEVSLRKRDHIRKLIHRIAEDNALKDPPADEFLQSCGIDKGDSSVRLMEKESCCGVKLESSDDHIKGQQSPIAMLEESSDKSATDKSSNLKVVTSQQYPETMLPIHIFSNLSLPMEQATSLNGDTTSRCDTPMPTCCQATSQNGDTTSRCHFDTPMPTCCQATSQNGDTTSRCHFDTPMPTSLIMIDCGPEVGEDLALLIVEDSEDESGSESTTSRCHFDTSMPTRCQATSLNGETTSRCHFDTPMPTSVIMIDCGPEVGEDLASCIVEDSEDESRSESTPRIRPSPFKNSPIRFHI